MIGKRTIVEHPRPFTGEKGSATGKHPPFRQLLRLMIAAAVLLTIILGIITGYVEKWLWMRQLDYAGIFWTLLSVQWAMFCSAFVFAFFTSGSISVRPFETAPLSARRSAGCLVPADQSRKPVSIFLPGF